MVLYFHYQESSAPDGSKLKRPYIPVEFVNGDVAYGTMALLDSGADITALPQEMAEVLGLDLTGPHDKCFGICGEVDSVRSMVKIVVRKAHERYVINVPCKVLLFDKPMEPLLGQVGFFDEFKITFDKQDHRISLKKVQVNNRRSWTGED